MCFMKPLLPILNLGCLMICRCIMGQQPRKFDATRGAILANLSELLVRQIERCVAACWQWSAGKQQQLRLVHFKQRVQALSYLRERCSDAEWLSQPAGCLDGWVAASLSQFALLAGAGLYSMRPRTKGAHYCAMRMPTHQQWHSLMPLMWMPGACCTSTRPPGNCWVGPAAVHQPAGCVGNVTGIF